LVFIIHTDTALTLPCSGGLNPSVLLRAMHQREEGGEIHLQHPKAQELLLQQKK